MKRIDPNTLYETDELKDLLKGVVKLETLRSFGLIGLGKGYFGKNVIDSLDAWCKDRARYQRGIQNKEDDHETNKTKGSVQTRSLLSPKRSGESVESQREKLLRKIS